MVSKSKVEGEMRQVVAELDTAEWHGFATETMWAERVGDSRYRLRSVPFYARGLSAEDVVGTIIRDGLTLITGVSIHGGHSTYRVFLSEPFSFEAQQFADVWRHLAAQGCTYERATARLAAVDVPPSADLRKVYEVLERGVEDGLWDFEEGNVRPDFD